MQPLVVERQLFPPTTYSSVQLVRDEETGVRYVLKTVKRSPCYTADAERKITTSLSHPNIVQCIAAPGLSSNQMLLPYRQLGDVYEWCRRHACSDDEIAQIATQLASALAHCHSRGIIHRDVKLENLLLVSLEPLTIELIDFGLAWSASISRQERPDDVCGTPEYWSPEMLAARSGKRYDEKVDVWGMGCAMYELRYGRTPFASAHAEAVVTDYDGDAATESLAYDDVLAHNIRFAPLAFPSHGDDVIARLISQCLQKEASERPSCQQLLANPTLTPDTCAPSPSASSSLS